MSRLRISRNFGESGSALFLAVLGVIVALLLCSPVLAASDRPRAGEGVLFLRPAFPEQADEIKTIVLYGAPGIERIAVVDTARLPSLSPSISPLAGVYAVAATGKKGKWFRVVYDDAGREGWIEACRSWEYFTWQDFLPGRIIVLLPDLQPSLTEVRPEPFADFPAQGRISPGQRIRILEIRDEWARIHGEGGLNGWFRWCDGNGKLLFVVEGGGE